MSEGPVPKRGIGSRMIIGVVVAAVLGALIGSGVTAAVMHSSASDERDPVELFTPLASGDTGDVGPWALTLSDYTLRGTAESPQGYAVTVSVRNTTDRPADTSALQFFAAIRADGGSAFPHGPNTVDCTPEAGTPFPRTQVVQPDSTTVGRLCFDRIGSVGGGTNNLQISAYVLDVNLLRSTNSRTGVIDGQSWSGPDSEQSVAVTPDGPNTRVHTRIVMTPDSPYRNWLPAASALSTGTAECTPGSGFAVAVTLADKPSKNLTAASAELCVVGPAEYFMSGFLPRAYWEFH
ncbi:hypothetical protein AB0N05_11980 [Nocardia sp. NPDC051030]|uniref:hypothetical protein n=1 Tax=Nocardia sp. NPDC051030 TaxID=3155162 RepID=UPI003432C394